MKTNEIFAIAKQYKLKIEEIENDIILHDFSDFSDFQEVEAQTNGLRAVISQRNGEKAYNVEDFGNFGFEINPLYEFIPGLSDDIRVIRCRMDDIDSEISQILEQDTPEKYGSILNILQVQKDGSDDDILIINENDCELFECDSLSYYYDAYTYEVAILISNSDIEE